MLSAVKARAGVVEGCVEILTALTGEAIILEGPTIEAEVEADAEEITALSELYT